MSNEMSKQYRSRGFRKPSWFRLDVKENMSTPEDINLIFLIRICVPQCSILYKQQIAL